MRYYLHTEDEIRIREVTEKASVPACVRGIRRIRRKSGLSQQDRELIEHDLEKTEELTEKLDSLAF